MLLRTSVVATGPPSVDTKKAISIHKYKPRRSGRVEQAAASARDVHRRRTRKREAKVRLGACSRRECIVVIVIVVTTTATPAEAPDADGKKARETAAVRAQRRRKGSWEIVLGRGGADARMAGKPGETERKKRSWFRAGREGEEKRSNYNWSCRALVKESVVESVDQSSTLQLVSTRPMFRQSSPASHASEVGLVD
jgi:hypothetical protein